MGDPKREPPSGYRVYDMGDHWLSRALLLSDGEHRTEEDAVAACWEHRCRIAARSLREAATYVGFAGSLPSKRGTFRKQDFEAWLRKTADSLERRVRELGPEGEP